MSAVILFFSKMRIAVNTRFLLPGKMEGIGLFSYETAKRLVALRPDDEFLFLFDRPFDPAYLFGPNVRGQKVFPPARHPLLWYLWFEWSVPRVLRQWQADVFYSPDGYASLRSRVPTVMVSHDLAFEHFPEQVPPLVSRYYGHFAPRFHRRAEEIVAVSEYTRQDILRHYDIPADKVTTGCNGVRDAFQPLSREDVQHVRDRYADGRPYFFYVGSVHPRKNVARLIRAYDRYRINSGEPKKLLLAGRFAWQTGDVREALDAARYRADIHLLGYLSEQELSRVMGAAFALTYVSLFEGFGVPLLEAMQAEVPIISANVSSMPEVCGPAALLVDPQDEAAIAAAMQRLEAEPDLRTDLITAGREQRVKFTWDRAAATVNDAIQRLGAIEL